MNTAKVRFAHVCRCNIVRAKTQHNVCWTPLCTHTINENKTCALQQTTGKTETKHGLCEIVVNITNGVIFLTYHEQYYIDIHVQI
jgi:hypothetical protein